MYLDDANAPAFYAGRQSAYPVGRLLLGAWRSSRLSLGHFVMTVGYRNAAKGCRALDVWLQAGEGPQELLTRVAASPWAPPVEELACALDLSRRQRVAEQVRTAERAFRPLVQVRPAERRPSSITLHGLCGGTARLTRWLPEDVGQWTAEAQDAAVRAFAADFRQRFGERRGQRLRACRDAGQQEAGECQPQGAAAPHNLHAVHTALVAVWIR